MIDTLKTDERLLRKMHESASVPVTKRELDEQRVSFVYGNLPNDSTITRERVALRLKENEGS